MKKIITILLMIILVFSLTGCTIGYEITDFKVEKKLVGNLEYNDEYKVYYYDKKSEITELEYDIFKSYDEEYFKDNSVIIITLLDNEANEYEFGQIKNAKIGITKFINEEKEQVPVTLILDVKGKINDIENFIVKFVNEDKTIGTHEHSYQEKVVEPTCTEKGYIEYTCNCGASYKDSYTEVIECNYEENICTVCGKCKYNVAPESYELSYDVMENIDPRSYSSEISIYAVSINTLQNYKDKNKLDKIISMEIVEKYDDYYTCCYLSSNAKRVLDEADWFLYSLDQSYKGRAWFCFSGINFYLSKLSLHQQKQYAGIILEEDTIKYDDMIWYEIPKDEEIPSKIGDYELVAITETKDVIKKSLEGELLETQKLYIESKHLYNENYEWKRWNNTYNEYITYDKVYNECTNKKYLVFSDYDHTMYKDYKCLTGDKFIQLVCTSSFYFEMIDGDEYIKLRDLTELGGVDLTTILEYKYEETINENEKLVKYYLFKWQNIYDLLINEYHLECNYEENICIVCGKCKYIESDDSESLNFEIMVKINPLSLRSPDEQIISMFKLQNYKEQERLNELVVMDIQQEFDNYYTCCYLSSKAKKIIDDYNFERFSLDMSYNEQYWYCFSGIDFYLSKLNIYNQIQGGLNLDTTMIDYRDIYWYQIPKDEKIPSKIGEYELIAITESKDVIESTIGGEILRTRKLYVDAKHLYENNNEYEIYTNSYNISYTYDDFYNKLINKKYLVFSGITTYTDNKIHAQLTGFNLMGIIVCSSLEYEMINDEEYIKIRDYTLLDGADLTTILEYKYEEIINENEMLVKYYWFKWKDIYNLIKTE